MDKKTPDKIAYSIKREDGKVINITVAEVLSAGNYIEALKIKELK